jgi:hypothetical protein
MFVVPAALVWYGALGCRLLSNRLLCYSTAVVLFWVCIALIDVRVEHGPSKNMQAATESAMSTDMSPSVFWSMSGAFVAVLYCGLNLAIAMLVIVPTRWLLQRHRATSHAA